MGEILGSIAPLFLALLAVIAVIYLSYVFSKYMAVGANKINGAKYMRIVDRMILGQDRLLAIIQIGEGYCLVGITGQRVEILKELTEEDLKEVDISNVNIPFQKGLPFKSILQKSMQRRSDK